MKRYIKSSWTAPRYKFSNTHGVPQAGVEVIEFDDYDEFQEYLDENPEIQDDIDNGYARLEEID